MRRFGIRARVTTGFACGALVLSSSMAVASYEITRGSLLAGRERTATRAAYLDATVVSSGLLAEDPDIVDVLRSLDTGGARRTVLRLDGTWYARSVDAGLTDAIPADLQSTVAAGRSGIQRVRTGTGAAVVVGIPLTSTAAFYVIDSLQELESTLRVLALVLGLVAAATTAAGAGLGRYATRRVLQPLTSVAGAAEEIAAGDFTTRLDPAAEPELQRLTTSFNHMVDQLARSIERDRAFAADVSHELRSPLQTLAAATSVLSRRQAHLDDRTAVAVHLIVQEVARFQLLVSNLIELALADQAPERTPVRLDELARRVCASRGIPEQIVTVEPDANTTWNIDRRRFEQILTNLLDNADRHGGGAIAVRLGSTTGGSYLEVDDEGPGVRHRDRDAIFGRFVRGHASRTRGHGDGVGLGLALVARHVSVHGGRVTVGDRPGGGARFRVELPREQS